MNKLNKTKTGLLQSKQALVPLVQRSRGESFSLKTNTNSSLAFSIASICETRKWKQSRKKSCFRFRPVLGVVRVQCTGKHHFSWCDYSPYHLKSIEKKVSLYTRIWTNSTRFFFQQSITTKRVTSSVAGKQLKRSGNRLSCSPSIVKPHSRPKQVFCPVAVTWNQSPLLLDVTESERGFQINYSTNIRNGIAAAAFHTP